MKITKKLEEIYPDLLPDTYVIHSEGGWHFWKDLPEAAPIYHEKIWPFIQRIKWSKNNDRADNYKKSHRPEQVNLCLNFHHSYPYCSLQTTKRCIKRMKNKKPLETFQAFYIMIHGALGRAFLPNPDKKLQVCHINDDPTNYLLHNLIYGTNRENHTGRAPDNKLGDAFTHNLFKMKGWAKG